MAGRPLRRARQLAESRGRSSRRGKRRHSVERDLWELRAIERGDCPTRGYVVSERVRPSARVARRWLAAHQRALPSLIRHGKGVKTRTSARNWLKTLCFDGRMFTAVKDGTR